MNRPPSDPAPLTDVLDEYALAGPAPDRLPEWVALYPYYERELRAFTEAWNVTGVADPEVRSQSTLQERGQALVIADVQSRFASLNVDLAEIALGPLDVFRPPATDVPAVTQSSPAAVDALLSAAGHTAASVRDALNISRALWAKLRSGMLSAESSASQLVLGRIVDGLAAVLERPRDAVVAVIPLSATLPAGYARSDIRPEASQVDIIEALRSDPNLSDQALRFYMTGEGSPPYIAKTP